MPIWRDRRYEYDANDNVKYQGKTTIAGLKTSDKKWHIWRYVYSGTNLIRTQGPLFGSWDDRDSLDWDW